MVFVIYHWLSVLIISLISHISLSIILRERRVQQCSKKEETVGCADPERLLTEKVTLVTPPFSYVNLCHIPICYSRRGVCADAERLLTEKVTLGSWCCCWSPEWGKWVPCLVTGPQAGTRGAQYHLHHHHHHGCWNNHHHYHHHHHRQHHHHCHHLICRHPPRLYTYSELWVQFSRVIKHQNFANNHLILCL